MRRERGSTDGPAKPTARVVGEKKTAGRARAVGRTLVDLALAAGCVYMVWLLSAAALDRANTRAELSIVTAEAKRLFDAFELYQDRNHAYPGSYAEARFDLATLDPLRRRGYYRGPITGSLFNRRADAYDSPDDQGPNREFWLELSLRSDPSIRFLLASSDDAPLGGGEWREGVFIYRDGTLERL